MEEKILFERDSFNQKNPKHLQKNVFIIYSTRAVKIEPATGIKIDTEITVFLPQKSRGFITSTLIGNEINKLFQGKHCLWVEVLNKSVEDTAEIKKKQPLGFLVWNLITYNFIMYQRKRKQPKRKFRRTNQRRKRQSGDFQNRYDFSYAGGDVVNKAAKFFPSLNKAATNDINNIAEQRIERW